MLTKTIDALESQAVLTKAIPTLEAGAILTEPDVHLRAEESNVATTAQHHGRLSLSSRVEPITSAAFPFHNMHCLLADLAPYHGHRTHATICLSISSHSTPAAIQGIKLSIRYRIEPSCQSSSWRPPLSPQGLPRLGE